MISAIDSELASESFEAAQAVRDALTAQMSATPSDVIAAVEEVIADAVDVALAATDMDTSLFVPIAVEEIREGTVRTEVLEDRDAILQAIADGTAIKKPIRLSKLLVVIKKTKGGGLAVTEEEILKATLELSKNGFFVEPTCASAVVGLEKLLSLIHI